MSRMLAIFLIFLSIESISFAFGEVELDGAGIKKIEEVARTIQENYAGTVSEEQLLEGALKGMFSSLDPYSAYIGQDTNNEMQIYSSGEFGGVGLELTEQKGKIKVIAAIDGTPAFKAGISSGDIIESVNHQSVYGMTPNEVIRKIRGAPGSKLVLGIKKAEKGVSEEKKLKREIIKIKSVYSDIISQGILYVRVTFFGGNTARQFERVLKKYKRRKQQINGIILDLRNNPGGYLDQSIEIANFFLDDGIIVSTKGKSPKNFEVFRSFPAENKISKEAPVIVLINKGSASGAEIVAAALKDHQKAEIMGERSFGKGSVQEIIQLDSGDAISLTTALYYTPKGVSIQGKGVEPDIIIDDVISPKDTVEKSRVDVKIAKDNILEKAVEKMQASKGNG